MHTSLQLITIAGNGRLPNAPLHQPVRVNSLRDDGNGEGSSSSSLGGGLDRGFQGGRRGAHGGPTACQAQQRGNASGRTISTCAKVFTVLSCT